MKKTKKVAETEVSENKQMKTEVIFILDKSGSMDKIKNDAIGGYNSFIDEQKRIKDDTTFTLVLFDSGYKKIYESLSFDDIENLTEETYVPSSMTALYDAIGITIETHLNKENKADRVLCVIMTDGEENASKKYTKTAINNIIEEQKKNGWEFIFMGANIDAFKEGAAIGVSGGNAFNFAATSDGIKDSYFNASSATAMYRVSSSSSDDGLMRKSVKLSSVERSKLFDKK